MRTSVGILCGTAAAVVAALFGGWVFQGLAPWTAWVAIVVGMAVAVAAFRATPCDAVPRLRVVDWVMAGVFALVSLRAFLWVLYAVGDDWMVLSPNNLGDVALHIHLIRHFAGGVPFWPESSILVGVPLTYPPGADLLNSILLLVGVDLVKGLVWVGLVGAALTGWALWRWGGAFAMAVFLFGGGLAGFALLRTGAVEDFQGDMVWKNFFLSMLVTQRGLLFAIPAGLVLLTAWREHFLRGGAERIPAWCAWGLYAAMPLFSLHTFLVLSVVLVILWVAVPTARWRLVRFVAASLMPASVGVLLTTGFFAAVTGFSWLPGGMMEGKSLRDWVVNFGLWLALIPASCALALLSRDREFVVLAVAGFGLAAACFLVSFATWPWDNMKIFLWAILLLAPVVWREVLSPSPPAARVAVVGLLFFSGAVSLVGGLDGRHGYPLVSRSTLDTWEVLLRDVPFRARLAAEPTYNSPALLLGRPVVCGYDGHLWSHGLDYQEKLDRLRSVLRRDAGWPEMARSLGAEFIADPSGLVRVPSAGD